MTADALLDHSRGQMYRTQILGKHFTSGRNRSYNLQVEPWANAEGAQQLRVSRDLYVQVNVGDSVCIVLHPGALGVRWYHVTACAAG